MGLNIYYSKQRKRRPVKKSVVTSSHRTQKYNNRTTVIFIWAYCTIISSVSNFVEGSSSSSNGNSGNAPFLVMSEMTFSDDDNGSIHDVIGEGQTNYCGNTDNNMNIGDSDSDRSDREAMIKDENKSDMMKSGASVASGGEGSGSDTDGEDEDKLDNQEEGNAANVGFVQLVEEHHTTSLPPSTADSTFNKATVSESAANSQPLRTLKRLQAMLDDSDYATHTVASSEASIVTNTNINAADEVVENVSHSSSSSSNPELASPITQQAVSSSSSSTNGPPKHPNKQQTPPEKLWTSKDRAKYRRTRRSEKQRRQELVVEQHARKIRDMQRQRIIREEWERKELEDLRLKQAEARERQQRHEQQHELPQHQQQYLHFDEQNTFSDDETDTDGGFELPNLPVHLSDGEATDDFSEEADEPTPNMRLPIQPSSNYSPPNAQQRAYQMPPPQMAQPYQNPPQQQQPPPQANSGMYQNYEQPYSQQYHSFNGQNNPQQTLQENQRRQYEQQYAAWAQAAASGYYYPPPPQLPPTATTFQQSQIYQQQPTPPQSSYQYLSQQQNQGTAYVTQQGQHHDPYHAQHQNNRHQQSFVPLQPAFVPRADLAEKSEQDRLYACENESQSINGVGDSTMDPVKSTPTPEGETIISPLETTTSSTTKPSSSFVSGKLGIKSAFVVTPPLQSASPLISLPSTSNLAPAIVGPINAEGPYCEYVNESVSFFYQTYLLYHFNLLVADIII